MFGEEQGPEFGCDVWCEGFLIVGEAEGEGVVVDFFEDLTVCGEGGAALEDLEIGMWF